MSSRPQFNPHPAIVNGDMSQATVTSQVTIIQKLSKISYGISWSGSSPVGTITAQVSNTYALDASGIVSNPGTDWTTLSSTSSAISGNSGTGNIDVTTGAYAVRLQYTKTSGTGMLQATINGKVT